jgi:hypothetical protein
VVPRVFATLPGLRRVAWSNVGCIGVEEKRPHAIGCPAPKMETTLAALFRSAAQGVITQRA